MKIKLTYRNNKEEIINKIGPLREDYIKKLLNEIIKNGGYGYISIIDIKEEDKENPEFNIELEYSIYQQKDLDLDDYKDGENEFTIVQENYEISQGNSIDDIIKKCKEYKLINK